MARTNRSPNQRLDKSLEKNSAFEEVVVEGTPNLGYKSWLSSFVRNTEADSVSAIGEQLQQY